MKTSWTAAFLIAALAGITACGGDDGSAATTSASSAPSPAAVVTEPPTTAPADPTTTTAAPTTDAPDTEAPDTTSEPTPDTAPTDSQPDTPTDGDVILSDEFDDDSNQWGPTDGVATTAQIVDGAFTVAYTATGIDPETRTVEGALYWPSVLDDQATSLSHVRIESSAQMGLGGVPALVCGVDPTNTDPRYYEFLVSSAGLVMIRKYEADGSPTTLGRFPAPSEQPDPTAPPALPDDPAFDYSPDATYRISGECDLGSDGSRLSLSLDGETLLTVEDVTDPITAGTVGLSYTQSTLVEAVEGFAPFEITFDDFVATDLGGDDPDDGSSGSAAPFDSSCTDPMGDIEDDKGNPVDIDPTYGADITAVSLSSDGQFLGVAFLLAEPPPADSEEAAVGGRPVRLRWDVFFDNGDERLQLVVFQDGTELQARIASNLVGGVDLDLTDTVALEGNILSVGAPLDPLGLEHPFSWSAWGQVSNFEIDRCGDEYITVD